MHFSVLVTYRHAFACASKNYGAGPIKYRKPMANMYVKVITNK
jgi:hypothetical protein